MARVTEKKNVSIEFLRIVAMAMVLYMHTVDIAVYDWTIDKGYHLNFLSFPEIVLMLLSIMAVNVFAMISGYLLGGGGFKISRLFSIYLHTAFYTVGITVLFSVFRPGLVSKMTWISAFSAIYSYWYIKSYFAVLLIIPILAASIHFFKNKLLFFSMLLFFISLVSTCIPGDMFCVQRGYSFVWLSIMFIIGGLIRELSDSGDLQRIYRRHKTGFITTFVSCLILNIVCYYSLRLILSGTLQTKALFALLSSYCSPVIVLQSILFFVLSLHLKIQNTVIRKMLLWAGPLSLAVYLIHLNPLLRYNLFQGAFSRFLPFGKAALSEKQYSLIFLSEICSVAMIFMFCCLVDQGRLYLFQLCHIPDLVKSIDRNRLVKFILNADAENKTDISEK